jgi:hypothetical protein
MQVGSDSCGLLEMNERMFGSFLIFDDHIINTGEFVCLLRTFFSGRVTLLRHLRPVSVCSVSLDTIGKV